MRLDRLEALHLFVLRHALVVEGSQLLADARVLLEEGSSESLGGVSSQDQLYSLLTQVLVDLLGLVPIGRGELDEGLVGGAGGVLNLSEAEGSLRLGCVDLLCEVVEVEHV